MDRGTITTSHPHAAGIIELAPEASRAARSRTPLPASPRLPLNRRAFLRSGLLGGLGVAAAALIGCGGGDADNPETGADTAGAAQGLDASSAETVEDESGVGRLDRATGYTTQHGRFVPFQIPEPDTEPKAGGALTKSALYTPGPLDPIIGTAAGTLIAANAVYNRVLGVHGAWDANPYALNELAPELAESWEVSEDGLEYTFHLRPDATFHSIPPLDGRRLVADDVKFSWERYAGTGSAHRANFTQVSSIDAPDDATVTVRLRQPTPDFIYPLATAYTTIHPPELVDSGEIMTKAIGTGPMILEYWTSDEGGAFHSNPDYFRGTPRIDRWEIPLERDATAAWAQYRVGRTDYGLYTESSDDLEHILKTNPDSQYFSSPVFSSLWGLSLEMHSSKWDDVRVRRALSLAYDRDELLDIVYSGDGVVLPQMDWRFIWEDQPTPESGRLGEWWRYDPAEATKLLEAAGAGGLEFDLLYLNSTTAQNSFQNEVLVEQFRRIGVATKLRAVDYNEYLAMWTAHAGEAEAYDGFAAFGATADHFVYGLYHSRSPSNRSRIDDPEIDAWAEQHQVELDPEARTELARKVWHRVMDQVYRLDKAAGYRTYLQQPWVRGVRFARAIGSGHFYLDVQSELMNAWIDR